MSKQSYYEKLKDPRWQKMRLAIMERDCFACTECGDQKATLHIHHRYYVSGRDPWEYPKWSLTTLCENCHEKTTGAYEALEDWELVVASVWNDWQNGTGTGIDFAQEIAERAALTGVDQHEVVAALLHVLRTPELIEAALAAILEPVTA